jgi:hypothetical protein
MGYIIEGQQPTHGEFDMMPVRDPQVRVQRIEGRPQHVYQECCFGVVWQKGVPIGQLAAKICRYTVSSVSYCE